MINSAVVKLIIFDCDGVLVDTETLANQILYQKLIGKGMPISEKEMTQLFLGLSFTDIQHLVTQHFNIMPEPGFWMAVQQETYTAFRSHLKPDPETFALLNALSLPYCVASSGSHEKMLLSLGLTGLLPLFENNLFSATQVANGKPAPDLFLLAADHFAVKPEHCLVIEDSLTGCRAAQAAGMQLLVYNRSTSATYPDVICDLQSLLGILS